MVREGFPINLCRKSLSKQLALSIAQVINYLITLTYVALGAHRVNAWHPALSELPPVTIALVRLRCGRSLGRLHSR